MFPFNGDRASTPLAARSVTVCDAYVQDGLVAFWDGDFDLPTWCDDGCVFPTAAYSHCTAFGCTTGTQLLPGGTAPFTLEFIADAPVVSTATPA